MSSPPSGTVTFLFTDIEGSTKLAQKYPLAMPALLARHHAILSAAVETRAGYVFQIRGDAFCAAFATASDALSAALDAQRGLRREPWDPAPLRVRMGLHTGAAEARDGNYQGYLTLAQVQRVMSVANGDQILVSNAAAALLAGHWPDGISLRDLGEHRLKGLQSPERLWQVVAPDLPQDFPALPSLNAIPNNLPPQLTSFIGRSRELDEIKDKLSRTHLLTLTGPGGTGKTRLSLRVAAEVLDQFKDGAWFVDLSVVADPALVLQAVTRALGVRDSGEQQVRDVLLDYLRSKELLLILDNFEQVISAAPQVKDLVVHAPAVTFLVTSRIILRVAGEQEYEVPQFSLPDPKHLPPLEQLSQYDAVRLFIDRARTYKSDWTITNENAPAVAEICYRLDALPLAIELAAARVRLLTPARMLAQLDNRLSFLKSTARDLPARQQTLRGAIDWSYNLLTTEEQALFCRLAVFTGGATLGAIEAICNPAEAVDVLAGLEALVDNSLIRQQDRASEPRFALLETIREYGAEQLERNPEHGAAVRQAHAAYFADLAQSQAARLTTEERESGLALLISDIENIRTAWRYWVAQRNLEQLGKFTDSLLRLNDARGWYQATVDLTSDLLNVLSSTVSTPERAREEVVLQMSLARALMITKGYYAPDAEQAYARALELCEREGDTPQLFPILRGLSRFHMFRAEFDQTARIGERILSLAKRLDDTSMIIEGNLVLGTAFNSVNPTSALAHLETALAAYHSGRAGRLRPSAGADPGVASLTTSALILWMLGFPDRARKRAGEALDLSQKLDHPFSMSYAHFHAGLLHLWLREPHVTREHADLLLNMAGAHEFQVWSAVGSCLKGAALAGLQSPAEGLALLQIGVTAYQGLNTPPIFFPLLLFLQAEACALANRTEQGLELLNRAIQILRGGADQTNTVLAMFVRLKGQLLLGLSQDKLAEAESCFQQSLRMGTDLQASMLALRAALSLTQLWRAQNKAEEGRSLLRGAYQKLTEGFATADLTEAKVLLDELT